MDNASVRPIPDIGSRSILAGSRSATSRAATRCARPARSSQPGESMRSWNWSPAAGRCDMDRAFVFIRARPSSWAAWPWQRSVPTVRRRRRCRPEVRPTCGIRLERPAVLTRGDRFIIRAYSPSITIGGGQVLDPHPPRAGIRTTLALGRYSRLDAGDGDAGIDSAVLTFVAERGGAGLPVSALRSRAGLSRPAADATIARLVHQGKAVRVADLLVAPDVVVSLSEQLLAALKVHHASQPLSEGLPREEARERLFGRASPHVFEHVLSTLADERRDRGARSTGARRTSGLAVGRGVTGARRHRTDLQGGRSARRRIRRPSSRRPTCRPPSWIGSPRFSCVRRRSSSWTRCCFMPTRCQG